MLFETPAPPVAYDITAGIAKAETAKTSPSVVPGISLTGGGSAFDTFAAGGNPADPAELTIPVWRAGATSKRTTRHIKAGGEEVFRSQTVKNAPNPQFTGDAAKTQFGILLQDPAKMQEWITLALRTGWVSADNANDADALGKAWDKAVDFAVMMKAATGGTTEVTPFEAAKMVASTTGSGLLAQQQYAQDHFTGTKDVPGGPTTQIDNTVTAAAGDALRQLLGRKPTAGENAAYQHGLQNVATANPTTVTHVGQYKDGELVAQTNTATGGYDEHQAQLDAANAASPDVAKNQNATTYFDALRTAIQAAV